MIFSGIKGKKDGIPVFFLLKKGLRFFRTCVKLYQREMIF
ncbi:hypothetical protein ATH33_0057 [Thermoactinomyces vulgaris]|nr:hypothetical protein ATH33_0057 [Thermoactinomyces vulgaris]